MRLERRCDSEQETLALAAWLGRQMAGGELIALDGPLGAGKTCFVRGLAEGLGLDASAVCSPTFIIWRRYADHAPIGLVHVDAFRIGGPEDLESIGWDELLGMNDSVVAVEWPQRIGHALPATRIEVTLEHVAPTSRLIRITAPEDLATEWEPRDD